MSDETSEALEAALRAHVLDEAEGAYLTDWIIYACSEDLNDPGVSHYVTECSEMTSHRLFGLVTQLGYKIRRDYSAEGDD